MLVGNLMNRLFLIITTSIIIISQNAWALSGTAVFFYRSQNSFNGDNKGIVLVDMETGESKNVLPDHYIQYATLSPDGKQIAFSRLGNPGGDVYIMNNDGSGVRKVLTAQGPTNDAREMVQWTWTTNGIMWLKNGKVWQLDPVSGKVKSVYTVPTAIDTISTKLAHFSADGTRIFCRIANSTVGHDRTLIELTDDFSSGAIYAAPIESHIENISNDGQTLLLIRWHHPYFHKAIMKAYEELLPPDHFPSYFLYFEINPASIDINIHPTKTEIKFEDERSIWQILLAATKEAIGKHNLSPTLDFSREGIIDIPVAKRDLDIHPPSDSFNPSFNPFEQESKSSPGASIPRSGIDKDWQKLYDIKNNQDISPGLGFEHNEKQLDRLGNRYLQLKGKYILAAVKSGLMLINQRRAHERILYDENIASLKKNLHLSQKSLFPENVELSPDNYQLCIELSEPMEKLGFDIRDFGQNSVIVHAVPANSAITDIKSVVESLLEQYKNYHAELSLDTHEKMARSAARAAAIPYGKQLTGSEMMELVDKLFASANPNTTPGGKAILNIIKLEDLEKHLA